MLLDVVAVTHLAAGLTLKPASGWFEQYGVTVVIAVIGIAGTYITTRLTARGNRDVAELTADSQAYTRASAIDAGVVDRLQEENVRLTETNARERAQHAIEKHEWQEERATLQQEIATLEARVQRLLSDVVGLRERNERRWAAGDDDSAKGGTS